MLYAAIITLGLATGYWFCQPNEPVGCITPFTAVNPGRAGTKRERIAIFVHGATHVPLVLLSPLSVYTNSIQENCWYARAQQRSRQDAATQEHSLMLDMGLSEINLADLSMPLHPSLRTKAAYHIIPAFDLIMQEIASPRQEIVQRYFTFGWSGNLRPEERTKGARDLYRELVRLKQENDARDVETEFALYAFSHGGQLVLELPAIRKELSPAGEAPITVELAVISGTPLYRQNTRNLLLGMFKICINVYSHGDYVQTFDSFTTPEGKCFQTIAETIPLPRAQTVDFLIVDACVTVHQRPLIGHQALFQMNSLSRPHFRSRRSDQYTKQQGSVCEFIGHLEPLPLLVLYPALFQGLSTIQESGYLAMTIDLQQTAEAGASARYSYHATELPHVSRALPLEKLEPLRKIAQESYASYVPSTFYDMIKSFGHAISCLLPESVESADVSC